MGYAALAAISLHARALGAAISAIQLAATSIVAEEYIIRAVALMEFHLLNHDMRVRHLGIRTAVKDDPA